MPRRIVPGCRAHAVGHAERFPTPRSAARTRSVDVSAGWIVRAGRLLVTRRRPRSPLRGSWDLPAWETAEPQTGADRLSRNLADSYGLTVDKGTPLGHLSHTIMQRRLKIQVFAYRLRRGRVASHPSLRWIDLADLDTAPVSGATQKIARRLGRERSDRSR